MPIARNSQLAVAQLPSSFIRVNQQPSGNTSGGLCFSCGKPGHWRTACPNISANFSNQQAKWLVGSAAQEQNLESEALPPLDSEPPFSEDSLLTSEFKSNDVAVSVRADYVNLFSSGKTLTRLASLLTLLSLATNCHCFKFVHLLLQRTISQQFRKLLLLSLPLVSFLVWNVFRKYSRLQQW